METNTRICIKAISWQAIGLITTSALAYWFIGSLAAASGMALSSAGFALLTYFLHEKLWARISWGTYPPTPQKSAKTQQQPCLLQHTATTPKDKSL